jgi:hypothetical protein
MTGPATTFGAPEASRAVIESAVRQALRHAASREHPAGPSGEAERLILLRAAPHWQGDAAIAVDVPDGAVTARVRGCRTVLAVLDALSEPHEPGSYLVVLTPCEDLGDSVLALAIGHEIKPISRWDLVREAFGAHRLDPQLFDGDCRWLAEAVLDAQPGGGWRRVSGPVLTADTVLARLAALRLGRGGEDELLDAAALLDWSRDETRVARFLSLRQEEQDGLAAWLEGADGPVARVVFRLLRAGQVADAIPFGLVVAELYGPAASPMERVMLARGRAEQRFIGGNAAEGSGLRPFGEAAESLVLRWNDNGHAADARAMCDRAEQILAELGAGDLAAGSSILAAGLEARVSALAGAIMTVLPDPLPRDLPAVEAALSGLREHRRCGADAAEEIAEAAVRLVRWLAACEALPGTVASGVRGQVRSWAWTDRALAVIASPDTSRTPLAQAAYTALDRVVRERRSALDQAFAGRLAAWSPAGAAPEDLLLVEDVLERIARPLASQTAPLIIVVDGMSAAVAGSLADGIAAMRIWDETGRHEDGREGALAVLPSVTAFSRTSLLCGKLRAGAQAKERIGFAAFWHGRTVRLFHKADLPAGPGARLSGSVLAAIGDPATVVGVVLNTIDDALRDGKEGSAPAWRLGDLTYLPELLAAAAAAGRPVVLTADHGHVIDHGAGIHPMASESARHRTGTPGEGEVLISGPRVLANGGQAVLPWDERVRYVPRRAGYHGGASLAEVVVPVLVFVPAGASIPAGWTRYRTPSLHEPPWWNPSGSVPPPAGPPVAARAAVSAQSHRSRYKPTPDGDTLFTADDIPVPASLGDRVVASALYEAQRAFVRKAPQDAEVAAIIEALAEAGGKLPLASVAVIAGQPPFRMAGYVAQLGRLLNADGYPVIVLADDGRTAELNTSLLREQFLGSGG